MAESKNESLLINDIPDLVWLQKVNTMAGETEQRGYTVVIFFVLQLLSLKRVIVATHKAPGRTEIDFSDSNVIQQTGKRK